ncbi:uncharacterized protein Z520_07217 [Fonsecaea multimorphosa CBS 102226]|uniref:NAD-dependent epimerase/dehydratase domain-containing protein n=1 Tax=Fonsecaea multimorphosa CBS 102226 TaxID=1442371 RepID=A0A0D2KKE5_9EURO|nr:uncharacterized protein Z520_07217 [Fonsecaea multimorphosa CBS 102226]KIX97103.1 hypothetical protein Z520_07217 [Fonsecaea multimorphosa CBS 102226]
MIIGGARGIGQELTRGIAKLGGHVAVLDRAKEPSFDLSELRRVYDIQARYFETDVTDKNSLEDAFINVIKAYGQINGCVTAAGVMFVEDFLSHGWDDAVNTQMVNVIGTFKTVQLTARQMKAQGTGGSIVMVSSVASHQSSPALPISAYAASKGAIQGLRHALAVELGPLDIRVNTISPGGGSILRELCEASTCSITCFVRTEDQVVQLATKGINAVRFNGLDDLERLEEEAREYDVVLNAASASHAKAPVAIIRGLAERKIQTGRLVHYIHTSGTSILSDQPVSGKFVDTKRYSDNDDIYNYEKKRGPYRQRITDIAVVEAGEQFKVPVYIVVPPTIYGKGTGYFSTISQQVPYIIRESIKRGQAVVVGKGDAHWNHVHICDLVTFYMLLLEEILASRKQVPSGKEGFYFCEAGEHTWLESSQNIANALYKQGLVATTAVKSISLQEAAPILENDEDLVEIVLASNSRCSADKGRGLGWKPQRDNAHFYSHFEDEVAIVAQEFK